MPRTARDRDLAFADEKLRRNSLGMSAFQDFSVEVLAALCTRYGLHARGACKRDYIEALYEYRRKNIASPYVACIAPSIPMISNRKRTHEHVADSTPGPSNKRIRASSTSSSSSGSSRESTPTLSDYCGSPTPTPDSAPASPHVRIGSLSANAERYEPASTRTKGRQHVLIPGPPPNVPVGAVNSKYAGYFRIGNAIFRAAPRSSIPIEKRLSALLIRYHAPVVSF